METIFKKFISLRTKKYAFIAYAISSLVVLFFFLKYILTGYKEVLFSSIETVQNYEAMFFVLISAATSFLLIHLSFSFLDYQMKEKSDSVQLFFVIFLLSFFPTVGMFIDPGPKIIGVWLWISRVMGVVFPMILLAFLINLMLFIIPKKKIKSNK